MNMVRGTTAEQRGRRPDDGSGALLMSSSPSSLSSTTSSISMASLCRGVMKVPTYLVVVLVFIIIGLFAMVVWESAENASLVETDVLDRRLIDNLLNVSTHKETEWEKERRLLERTLEEMDRARVAEVEKNVAAAAASTSLDSAAPVFGAKTWLGCPEFDALTDLRKLGSGETKDVFLAKTKEGKKITVKRIRYAGHARTDPDSVSKERLLLMEATYLDQLRHENILGLLGRCLRGGRGQFEYATEYMEKGEFSTTKLGSLSFEKRIHVALDVLTIMDVLENSPIGTCLMMDFKPSQFLVDNDYRVKLGDVDTIRVVPYGSGISKGETCKTDHDCRTYSRPSPEWACGEDKKCVGYGAKSNLYHAIRLLIKPVFRDVDQLDESRRTVLKHVMDECLAYRMTTQEAIAELKPLLV
eukprot:TRINITY_DN5276_c0_g1_i2.p1 TRINITY_DN5276_c0_g1~~TRINITY_DN5276_c0_g1_i2.p1  ORF type:complete len:414 (-),score=94.08 TRINITY_DN5276_c0_g1_i2:878-2119(-)